MSGGPADARGCAWLVERPVASVTPEDMDDVTREIVATARAFAQGRVAPLLERMERGELDLNVGLLREAGALGLLAPEVPEEHGGLDLPKIVSTVIAEEMGALTGGFAVTFGAHATIGTLPLVWFGTDEQKRRHLPGLASGEAIAAYALSEASSGSDALGARSRAVLDADGAHYRLTGGKMWISNAGFADLFTVFAKVDGDHFTAFLVERDAPGLALGAEEHKMGIRSSSTRALLLEEVVVPAGNVLGEIGAGHRIAFNVLNVGRYKVGANCLGAAKRALRLSAAYAAERRAFGRAIAEFGLMRHKLGEMAARIFALESVIHRAIGSIDAAVAGHRSSALEPAAIEEFAVEASIVKVLGSEVLDACVDEGVQIHGGYGFSAEYEIERLYRDSRINRIFDGTSEINRLLITGMLLRRARRGTLPLLEADRARPPAAGSDDALERLRRLCLVLLGAAVRRFGDDLGEEQEVMAAVADIAIELYAAESAALRAGRPGAPDVHRAMAELVLERAWRRSQSAVSGVAGRIGAAGEALLRSEAARRPPGGPADLVALRRGVADAVLASTGYPALASVPVT